MRSREFFLLLALSCFLSAPAFSQGDSDEGTPATRTEVIEKTETFDMTKLATSVNSGEAPVVLAPDEQLVRKTVTTSYAKPAFSGVYTDCFPELCPMEAADDAEIPTVNWAGVQSCCQGIACFFVDQNGRHAMTDHFFRCVTANTPSSPLVQTTSEIENAKKKHSSPAGRKPASAKRKG